ncbi:hypothetical protein ACFO3K_11430 [Cellulomonas algicola]|uniref:hypothetical protein n=1 Tax=Cellulomonas algicola TaxID=2071633 RepID=UPI001C3FA118|nr:hypothetical protein [Cellulomonas algicola]
MSGLLRAELARARARPFVWFVAVALTLGAVGLVATGWWETRPPSAQESAAADAAFAEALRSWDVEGEAIIARCHETERAMRAELGDDYDASCELLAPAREVYEPRRADLGELLDARLPSVGVMLVLAMLMVGVGLVTAEFTSGSIGTWLTFAPRRGRVFVSKLAAALLAALPCGLLGLAVLVVGLVGVCLVNGTSTDVPGAEWAASADRSVRWLASGLGATALGVGLAFALRHAAAVTGVLVWWAAAVETALPLVLPVAGFLPLSTNVRAWLSGGTDYWVPECVPDPAVPGAELCEQVAHHVSAGQGALVASVVVLVALAAGWLTFRLRDV